MSESNFWDKAVLLNVVFKSFGVSRKLSDGQYQVDADKSKTKATKKICQSDELRAIGKHDGETRKLIACFSLPASQFKAGLYAVKIQAIDTIDAKLVSRQLERAGLVQEFLLKYPALIDRDKLPAVDGGLGSLFDSDDYPCEAEVREAFSLEYTYSEISAPGKLSSISKAMYDREKDKAAEMWRNVLEDGKALLRARMLGIVQHISERLSGSEDGKKKIFKDSLIGNALDFLNNFDFQDMAGDSELRVIVDQMAAALKGVTPADLRKDDALKDATAKAFDGIKQSLDAMMAIKPQRKIVFDDPLADF